MISDTLNGSGDFMVEDQVVRPTHSAPSCGRPIGTPWFCACDGPISQVVATGAGLSDLPSRHEVRDGPFEERLTGFRSKRG